MKKIAALIAFTTTLGACSLAPDYERPASPVSSTYADTTPPGNTIATTPWQQFFTDAQLQVLITQALQNNRDLRIAALNIERTRAQYGITTADRWPTLSATAQGNRQHVPADLSTTGEEAVNSQYSAGLGLAAFELDFFGHVRNLSDAALQKYLATEEARNAAQLSLVADIADLWLTIRADDARLALTQATLTSRERSVKLMQARFTQGVTSELDLRQSQSLLASAQALLAQQQRLHEQHRHALALLVGNNPGVGAAPSNSAAAKPEDFDSLALPESIPAGLPSDLLEQRPDIREAEAQLRSANANIGAARANFFPRISLTASAGSASRELDGLFDGGSRAWSFAPSVNLPLFDGGRNRATLDMAKADRDIAVAHYEKAVQAAFRDVADALTATQTLEQEFTAQQAETDALTNAYALSERRYRGGVVSYLEMLDAERSLLTSRQQLIDVRLARQQSRIALFRAVGGGWQSQDDQRSANNATPASSG
jgi:multidrug efflux system outer membrane protein